jgi:hypothetical protein
LSKLKILSHTREKSKDILVFLTMKSNIAGGYGIDYKEEIMNIKGRVKGKYLETITIYCAK